MTISFGGVYLVLWFLNVFCNVRVRVCGGVLVIFVLVYTVFCIVCAIFLYYFV